MTATKTDPRQLMPTRKYEEPRVSALVAVATRTASRPPTESHNRPKNALLRTIHCTAARACAVLLLIGACAEEPQPKVQVTAGPVASAPAVPEPPASAPASQPAAASRPAEPPIVVQRTSPVREDYAVEGLQRIDYVSGVDGVADWALVLPNRENTWIVCVHGHGSTGNQLYTREDIRRSWLTVFKRYHFGIVTPNLRGNSWMSPAAAADLHGLLDHIRDKHQAKRFILASGSMGGTSNLIYSVLHPEDVDAAIALCPATDLTSYYQWCRTRPKVKILQHIADAIASAYGCEPDECPDLYREHSALANADRLTMPVYVAHGAQDATIPITQSESLYAALKFRGITRFCEIPEGDHDAPLRQMPDALEWVLKRMR